MEIQKKVSAASVNTLPTLTRDRKHDQYMTLTPTRPTVSALTHLPPRHVTTPTVQSLLHRTDRFCSVIFSYLAHRIYYVYQSLCSCLYHAIDLLRFLRITCP